MHLTVQIRLTIQYLSIYRIKLDVRWKYLAKHFYGLCSCGKSLTISIFSYSKIVNVPNDDFYLTHSVMTLVFGIASIVWNTALPFFVYNLALVPNAYPQNETLGTTRMTRIKLDYFTKSSGWGIAYETAMLVSTASFSLQFWQQQHF